MKRCGLLLVFVSICVLLAGCEVFGTNVDVRMNGTPITLPSEIALPDIKIPSSISLPKLPDIQLPSDTTPTPAPVEPVDAGQPTMPEGLPQVTVVRVVDGDTVRVDMAGQEETLRLIGINTPETVDPRGPVECFGKEASDHAKQLLEGQTVWFEDDKSQDTRDRYGRLLGYLWLPNGRLFNLEMIAQGYAYEYTYETPYKYQSIFKQAQDQASAAQTGLWAANTCGGELKPVDG